MGIKNKEITYVFLRWSWTRFAFAYPNFWLIESSSLLNSNLDLVSSIIDKTMLKEKYVCIALWGIPDILYSLLSLIETTSRGSLRTCQGRILIIVKWIWTGHDICYNFFSSLIFSFHFYPFLFLLILFTFISFVLFLLSTLSIFFFSCLRKINSYLQCQGNIKLDF